jgi:hypothetical protein
VGLLDSFERGLEKAVNGAFAKTFKSGLQPIEITSALRRELDTKAAVVARDRILVPNHFTVLLAPGDHERMTAIGPSLVDEFRNLLQSHATAQHYSFAGAVTVELERNTRLSEGMVEIRSGAKQGVVSWKPFIDVNGKRHPLVKSRTVIGRGSDADITVDDSSISRKHVEILWDGQRAQVNDLGSTNGSKLDGHRVTKALLQPDSLVEIGRTRIVFRVVAEATTDRIQAGGSSRGR